MKLTSMSEARVGKFTMDSMCIRSISARRASRIGELGDRPHRRDDLPVALALGVAAAEKYSAAEPGSATTSKVGFGM